MIRVHVGRSGDGRVFANVSQYGKQLAHLRAGESWEEPPATPDAWARDVDGTGSLHMCAKDDAGAIPLRIIRGQV